METMRVVIAPDKFKGSLTADQVADRLEAGLLSFGGVTVDKVPVADGGEGTLDAAVASGFTRHAVTVSGPTGEPVEAAIAVRGGQAVVEMAAASGLAVLPGGVLRAREATSRGTGQLIRAALDWGCTEIVLAVGGSANTDGGAGMLAGLGARLLDDAGRDLPHGGAALAGLAKVDLSGLDSRVAAARFTLASDVDNPLLGPNGAAAIFGPQKGATAQDVEDLGGALAQFVRVLADELGPRAQETAAVPGAGAAGGVGYAALAVLGAQRRPGIDVVLELTGLAKRLQGAAVVVTGEGSLDGQSLGGKTPIGVAQAAAAAGVPVIAVCGRSTLTVPELAAAGFEQTYALTELERDVEKCMANAGELVEEIGRSLGAYIEARYRIGTGAKEYAHD
jgi:glycerate 2-kinase